MNYNMFDEIDYFTNFKGSNMNELNDDDNLNMMKNQNLSNGNNINYYLAQGSSGLELYQPYEGYTKGNLFKNLYQGYKNYKPSKIKINGEYCNREVYVPLATSEGALVASINRGASTITSSGGVLSLSCQDGDYERCGHYFRRAPHRSVRVSQGSLLWR